MVEPDDFGLGSLRTLTHLGGWSRCGGHSATWRAWESAVWSLRPVLMPTTPRDTDASDATATHVVESVGSVRVGCRLVLPTSSRTMIRGGVVAVHGYEGVPTLLKEGHEWQALADRGAAVLVMRVRGYAGSQVDVTGMVRELSAGGFALPRGGALYTGGGLWITHGLGEALGGGAGGGTGCAWSVALATADVVCACRALREWLSRRGGGMVGVYGESFGGGLAVLAGSALSEREPIDRLVLSLPSLGDWAWRLEEPGRRCAGGAGRHVRDFLMSRRDVEERVREVLWTFDASVAARRVRCPVLAKLAMMDDVVPAPCAAAVFNGLATAPGEKRRWIVRYGHFDGGLADLRRHAMFRRLAVDALDPMRDMLATLADEPDPRAVALGEPTAATA